MSRRMRAVISSVSAIAAFLAWASWAHAAGPWRATIVDAETGQPLEGVVVLAEFIKYTSGWAGDSAAEYYGSDEVMTGPDGRFEIPARTLWNPIRWRTRVNAEFRIFKPGYGRARARHSDMPPKVRDMDETWFKWLQHDGVVIELPPLKTFNERLTFYHTSDFPSARYAPADRESRLREAINRERRYLGLGPL
jgi:hypothetical protein